MIYTCGCISKPILALLAPSIPVHKYLLYISKPTLAFPAFPPPRYQFVLLIRVVSSEFSISCYLSLPPLPSYPFATCYCQYTYSLCPSVHSFFHPSNYLSLPIFLLSCHYSLLLCPVCLLILSALDSSRCLWIFPLSLICNKKLPLIMKKPYWQFLYCGPLHSLPISL